MEVNKSVSESVMSAIERIRDMDPNISDILDRAKSGEMSEEVAMANLLETVSSNPDLNEKLIEMMREFTTSLGDVNECHSHDFNPLIQAAIVERTQFDGDAPEIRTGPMARGVNPSVPVSTTSRNPVAIGLMLNKASSAMKKTMDNEANQRRLGIESQYGDSSSIVLANDADITVSGADPVGYQRGEMPKPMTVRRPSGSSLLNMSSSKRQELTWKFLSTTHGRRSAIATIRDTVAQLLSNGGLPVRVRDFDPLASRVTPLAYAEWTITMSGEKSVQPGFSLIDVSAKALAIHILTTIKGDIQDGCFLEVEAVNRISDREVGWMARVMPPQE